jgi:4-hydroxy-4-methyl-2-oxoglutarate aldolase
MKSNDAWRELGSANVCDAMRSCGKTFQAMDPGIRNLSLTMSMAGPAFTVRCYPGATWAVEKALELAQPGDVLVIDGGGFPDAVLMGGLMSTRAHARGLAGAIVDGAVRDIDQIIAIDFPMFARHITPRGGTFAEIGEWSTTICCGRLPVRPGDWIVADSSGIAVVPLEMVDEVFDATKAINAREARMLHHLEQGKSLSEASAAAKLNSQSIKSGVAEVSPH